MTHLHISFKTPAVVLLESAENDHIVQTLYGRPAPPTPAPPSLHPQHPPGHWNQCRCIWHTVQHEALNDSRRGRRRKIIPSHFPPFLLSEQTTANWYLLSGIFLYFLLPKKTQKTTKEYGLKYIKKCNIFILRSSSRLMQATEWQVIVLLSPNMRLQFQTQNLQNADDLNATVVDHVLIHGLTKEEEESTLLGSRLLWNSRQHGGKVTMCAAISEPVLHHHAIRCLYNTSHLLHVLHHLFWKK